MNLKPVHNLAEAKQLLFRDLPAAPRVSLSGESGLARGRYLMAQLGNPQNSYPAVHIAGTSGKGSTAYIISSLLQTGGKTVGLHVSPHIYDLRERMQVNGNLISTAELCRQINELLPVINAMSQTVYGAPTYFEVTMALAHLVFREHQVDYGIIETGIGGLYDVSNLITRTDKLAVLTQVGMDHTTLLGDSLSKIAAQKAGIMQPGTHAVALWQDEAVRASFDARARTIGATLEYLRPEKIIRIKNMGIDEIGFDLSLSDWNWPDLTLSLTGSYQARNAALAMRAVQYLCQRDGWALARAEVAQALESIKIPARFETIASYGKTIVLDAAHNPQELSALAQTISQVWPNQRLTFVLAMTYHPNSAELLAPLLPMAAKIVLTGFTTDSLHKLQAPQQLAEQLDALDFSDYTIEPTIHGAIQRVHELEPHTVIACGSVYSMRGVRDGLESMRVLVPAA